MLAGWCVIRIRIRVLPQSTQTEVNEHVCLQWDVSLSEPAVTRLEGNCWEWPLYLSVIYTSSQSQVFTYGFFFCSPLWGFFVLIVLRKNEMSVYLLMRFAEQLLPDAIWKMPRVHDKLSVTLIIHTDAEDCPWRMTVSAVLAASVTNHQVIIFACVQNCICEHDNIFNMLYFNED